MRAHNSLHNCHIGHYRDQVHCVCENTHESRIPVIRPISSMKIDTDFELYVVARSVSLGQDVVVGVSILSYPEDIWSCIRLVQIGGNPEWNSPKLDCRTPRCKPPESIFH